VRKRFSQLNYYEILDIKPDAVLSEIRQAYNAAMQMYQAGSLASYSFFSEDERQGILLLIDRAYTTLINEKARKAYDDELVGRGDLTARDEMKPAEKKPVSIFDINRAAAAKAVLMGNEDLKRKIQQSAGIGEILKKGEFSGADLKAIRTELDLPVEQIAQETRIRLDYLRSIEDDNVKRLPAPVFLKGFVKSYLKCLGLDSVEELSARYMETISRLSRS